MSGQRTRTAYDREILRLAVPALGALVAEPLYVLVDTAIVGNLGTPQLAGLGVASTLILTGYYLFVFLAYGTTGTVARLLGAGERGRAAEQGVQSLWLGAGIGVALAAGGLVVAEPLVAAMGAEGEVREHALTYFRISMAGVPALTLVLAGTGYLRGLQDTRTPLVVAVGTAVANIVLETWFVLGLDWDSPARRGRRCSCRSWPRPCTCAPSPVTSGRATSRSAPTVARSSPCRR